jgi:hypothetical protein
MSLIADILFQSISQNRSPNRENSKNENRQMPTVLKSVFQTSKLMKNRFETQDISNKIIKKNNQFDFYKNDFFKTK